MRTGSATMPSTFLLLMRSMQAQGKVSSWPNKIPIFFIPLGSSQRSVVWRQDREVGGNGITGTLTPGPSPASTIPPMRRWIALARHELLPLILLVLIAGGVWLFAGLAGEVREGETRRIDRAVLLALAGAAGPSRSNRPAWVGGGGR